MCFKDRKKICHANISKTFFAELTNLGWALESLIIIIFVELAITYFSYSFEMSMYFYLL